jgi:hypothetical protein
LSWDVIAVHWDPEMLRKADDFDPKHFRTSQIPPASRCEQTRPFQVIEFMERTIQLFIARQS